MVSAALTFAALIFHMLLIKAISFNEKKSLLQFLKLYCQCCSEESRGLLQKGFGYFYGKPQYCSTSIGEGGIRLSIDRFFASKYAYVIIPWENIFSINEIRDRSLGKLSLRKSGKNEILYIPWRIEFNQLVPPSIIFLTDNLEWAERND